jgi:DNA polymerase-1
MKEKTALIDADSLIYFEMGKPTLEEALEGIDSRINQMLIETGATHYAGFLTSGRCFRYTTAKTRPYKGNRKHGSKPIIFPAIKEYLRQQWNCISIPELEADDLVSIFHTDPFGKTVICSPDKDVLYQNRGIHYNYGKAETVVVDEVQANWFLWKQVLMGDSTDGIPGLPKVGPKTAETWLEDIDRDKMPTFVLNKYIEKFGISEGIHKFVETFKLVYILKTKEDAHREAGVELENLKMYSVEEE